jgi:hypothetical protein
MNGGEIMQTTLDLEEDVLRAAEIIAHQRGISLGKAISELARQALALPDEVVFRNGVPLFPIRSDAQVVTPETVNQLRDETP